jgi:hypothetical protein
LIAPLERLGFSRMARRGQPEKTVELFACAACSDRAKNRIVIERDMARAIAAMLRRVPRTRSRRQLGAPKRRERSLTMRSHLVLVLLSSLGLFACGGANQKAKNEPNPWGNFTGTYSKPAAPREKAEKAEKAESAEASKKEAEPKADEEAAATEAPARAPKKTSQATVKGESVSSVSVESLTEASTSALGSQLVSNGVMTGPQYELVQVELKTATVQIIRPAEKPAPNGLPIPSPKAKNAELEQNDAGWYDEEADVLVIVNAPKKAAAQKALGAIIKHP